MFTSKKKTRAAAALLVFLLALLPAACSGSGESNGGDVVNAPVLVVGQDINEGDEGSGPVQIESRYGRVYIPEGMAFRIFYAPETSEGAGKYDTIRIRLGIDEDNIGGALITVGTNYRAPSLDEVVDMCVHKVYWDGEKDSALGGEELFNNIPFRAVTLQDADGSNADNYLMAYYVTEDGLDGYVEVFDTDDGFVQRLPVTDPLIRKMLENSVFK